MFPKGFRLSFFASLSVAVASYGGGFSEKADLKGIGSVRFSSALEELVSARGEKERYAPCGLSDGEVRFSSECGRRKGADVWDARASVSNASSRARFLRVVFRAGIPFPEYTFWNGYTNQKNMKNDRASVEEHTAVSYLFPAIAAMGSKTSLVLGFDPMLLASRVDTKRGKTGDRDCLEMSFPVYLPPGDAFSVRTVLTSAPARYRWRDVVERWYGLFPEVYEPLPDVHPGLRSAADGGILWSPKREGLSSVEDQRKALKSVFGEMPCWSWCYRPFARAGDWAITDEWSVGWKGQTPASLQARRELMHARLAPAAELNVAPMWYLNVTWTERGMALEKFPGILIGDKPRPGRFWNQQAICPVYSAGGTPYEKLFRSSLKRIPAEYPEVKGIGWDSCFATRQIPEKHIGFAGTPSKSFRNGIPFVHEAVGLSGLLDYNRTFFTGKHRMANAVNYKLTAPWMIAARSDTTLYEGTPMNRPEWLWRLEAHRARLGGRKVMTWLKGCEMKNLAWAKLDKMSPEDAADAHRQILDDILFISYWWGVVPSSRICKENNARLTGASRELVSLAASGWHASPACDAPKGILVARYGDGGSTRLAVINPGYEARDAELFLPGGYWSRFPDGKRIAVHVPARQVMMVDPFTGKSRPASTLPPAPIRKPFGRNLLEWIARSSL